jgi:hypothetical protein
VSDRKSWLSESSTSIRVIPNAPAIKQTIASSAIRKGCCSEKRPARSIPKAMLWDLSVRREPEAGSEDLDVFTFGWLAG